MELAILGGLSIIGYEISKYKNRASTTRHVHYDTKYTNQSNNIHKLNEQFEKDVATRFNDPNVVRENYTEQTFHNNMTPYFTSAKSQNTNSEFKDRKLDTYTGKDEDMFAKHKSEQSPLFHMDTGKTYVHGEPSKDTERIKEYQESLHLSQFKNNNILPFDQKKIGRGLGLAPDESVGGGFHDFLRVMPDNVNGYRKNNFENRVISGKSTVDNRTIQPNGMSDSGTKGVYDLDRRPVQPTKSSVDAQSIRSGHVHLPTNRGQEGCLKGVPDGHATQQYTHIQPGYTRTDDRCSESVHGNPGRPGLGVGYYANSKYLTHPTDRETCNDQVTNLVGLAPGTSIRSVDGAKNTIRSTTEENCQITNVRGGEFMSHRSVQEFYVNPNQKEELNNKTCNFSGGGARGTGASYSQTYNVNPTIREDTSYTSHVNPAGSYIQGGSTYKTAYNTEHTDPYLKKDMMLSSHVPNVSRVNVPMSGEYTHKNMFMTNDSNPYKVQSNTLSKSTMNFATTNQLGYINDKEQIPVENTRLNNITKQQLKNNPLANDITRIYNE
jgi:hypothetical protein